MNQSGRSEGKKRKTGLGFAMTGIAIVCIFILILSGRPVVRFMIPAMVMLAVGIYALCCCRDREERTIASFTLVFTQWACVIGMAGAGLIALFLEEYYSTISYVALSLGTVLTLSVAVELLAEARAAGRRRENNQ